MNENSLTLCLHVMKLCRLTYKTYQTDVRQTKIGYHCVRDQHYVRTFLLVSPNWFCPLYQAERHVLEPIIC